ncbi:BZ3500_MvSof-1268-A1-R1_Chr11-1g03203 [Microbotryum saponariae]|uniref:BZ3500_MvSof-1268-A1-R1_Chr11-1g03203 protein n=1 Tax=Microbotryum saponariae TaxID=289078 RepID=A0A2X0LUH7_9BASI|nr:BZ3501_MvSof-1269-A2-R1_Chr11g02778 [Microbotryum saponariae]SDA03763.1 BZ3500_MvSof-1268-A1-R1_Chr11-1g03203 [Microbotryum saponariae]
MPLLQRSSSASYPTYQSAARSPVASTSTSRLVQRDEQDHDASAPMSMTVAVEKGKGRAVEDMTMAGSGSGSGAGDGDGRPVVQRVNKVEVWTVQWREPQHRKNKTWERDGFLIIKGSSATLRDENGKTSSLKLVEESARCVHIDLTAEPPEEQILTASSHLQIDDTITYAEYVRQFHDSSIVVSAYPSAGSPSILRAPMPGAITPGGGTPRALPRPTPSKPSGLASVMTATKLPVADQGARVREAMSMGMGMASASSSVIGVKRHTSRENEDPIRAVDHDKGTGGYESDLKRIRREDETQPGRRIDATRVIDRTNVDGPRLMATPPAAQEPVKKAGKEYLCQYRKYSTKTNPTWEGDGILIVTGTSGSLKDRETRKTITNGAIGPKVRLDPEQQINMGGYTLEIESEFTAAPTATIPIVAPSARPPPVRNMASMKPPARPPPSIFDPIAVAASIPSSNFYIPGVTPQASKAFQDPTHGMGSAGKGKGKPELGPQPRFDPTKAGAVVMRRPDEEHELAYNRKGVKFMYEAVMGMRGEGQGCILADEMGLGKSVQAISLIWTLLSESKSESRPVSHMGCRPERRLDFTEQNPYWGSGTGVIQRAMIVCPVTLVKNWSREIRLWLGYDLLRPFIADSGANIKSFCATKSYNLLIIGYERLRTVIDDIKAVQPPIGLIICDEGHRLKSSDAKISKALRSLSCKRRVILSGTPIQNDLQEYHSMVDFVNPGLLDSYSVFKKHFENAIIKSREPGASAKDKKVGEDRSKQLTRIGTAFLLRRAGDVIAKYLPPKLEYTVFIAPTPLEVSIYEEILIGSAARALQEGSITEQLSLLMVLRQLCNTPGLLMQSIEQNKKVDALKKPVVELLRKAGNDSYDFALSGKLLALGTLLHQLRSIQGEKIVVVSNFVQTLNIIERHCRQKRYPFSRLDGNTPQAERIALVEAFNRGKNATSFVFLLSSKAGGTGLNSKLGSLRSSITGASRLVLIDSDWNPSTDQQAMARIHREGQKKQCVIYRFLTAGTIDEKIFQRQVTKMGLSTSLMDDGQSGGAGKADSFTPDDLRSIFKLHQGVACQTHDLLGCKCHLDLDNDDEEGAARMEADLGPTFEDPSSSFQAFEPPGFTQASQFHALGGGFDLETVQRDESRRLGMLNNWAHYNCCDEGSVDEIEDTLLRSVVYQRVIEAVDGAEGSVPEGRATYRLRGGQVGFVFGKKSG